MLMHVLRPFLRDRFLHLLVIIGVAVSFFVLLPPLNGRRPLTGTPLLPLAD